MPVCDLTIKHRMKAKGRGHNGAGQLTGMTTNYG